MTHDEKALWQSEAEAEVEQIKRIANLANFKADWYLTDLRLAAFHCNLPYKFLVNFVIANMQRAINEMNNGVEDED